MDSDVWDKIMTKLGEASAEVQEETAMVASLRVMAGMLTMGERIAFGSDAALMEEAANLIERMSANTWAPSDSALRLRRIERDLRDLESELREQASGSQDGYLLEKADRIRNMLA